MITFNIACFTSNECETILDMLNKFDVKDIKRDLAVGGCYEYISFECTTKTWKKIRKKMNLEIYNVFAKVRVGV